MKLLITGAGVDKTEGINFPLANNLLPEVTKFINKEGKEFDRSLRKALPHLRFTFQKFITSEIDGITQKDAFELKRIVELVTNATSKINDDEDISKKRGNVIITLFQKLVDIQNVSHIDEETYKLISEAFGEEFTDSDFVIDVQKMSLSDTFKSILKVTLKESLTQTSNPIADAIAAHLLDIEQLLIQKFLGFYNNYSPDVKNYIYISWCLWAFLVWRQNQLQNSTPSEELPFYKDLPHDIRAITLNYTTFLTESNVSEVIHFHGGLDEYVRMDTRQLIPIPDLSKINLKEFIQDEISSNIDLSKADVDEQRHVIPSMVPPLKLKPILSHKYIETWSKAAEWVNDAEKIVIVGYSFNTADEHFNDIIRKGKHQKYDIVNPDALSSNFLKRVERIFGISETTFTNTKIQGKNSKTISNIRLIAAKADEINIKSLFKD